MIIGTGLDIIDVERIRQIHKRWGDRFLKKFLRAKEIEEATRRLPVGGAVGAVQQDDGRRGHGTAQEPGSALLVGGPRKGEDDEGHNERAQ